MLASYCLRFVSTLMLFFLGMANAATNIEDIDSQVEQERQIYLPYQGVLLSLLDDKKNHIYHIKKKLERANLPENFYLIPLIESRYNNHAVSHAGAVGMWQIMPLTAVRFGLQVDSKVDERLHFESSTDAAIQYLKFLFQKFKHNEFLTLAAYNAGEGRVGSALKMPLASAERFSSIQLPAETKQYIYRYYALVKLLDNKHLNKHSTLQPINNKRLTMFDSLFHRKKIISLEAIKPFI